MADLIDRESVIQICQRSAYAVQVEELVSALPAVQPAPTLADPAISPMMTDLMILPENIPDMDEGWENDENFADEHGVIHEEQNTPDRVAFWNWLPLAYRDGHLGEEPKFTKYNMEVAHAAGWQHALDKQPAVTPAPTLAEALELPEVKALAEAAQDVIRVWRADGEICVNEQDLRNLSAALRRIAEGQA